MMCKNNNGVLVAVDAYTQRIVGIYCAIEDRTIEEIQDITNQIEKGIHPEVTKLITGKT